MIGNAALRPERTASWEAGVEQALAGGRVSLQATWFDQHFRDLVQYQASPPRPGEPNYFNLGAARADGLELAAGADAGAGVRLDASYTYLRTRVTDQGAGGDPSFLAGRPLLRRPAHSFGLTAGWRPSAAGALSATVSYVGRREDLDFSDPNAYPAPRVTLGPYARLDLSGERALLRAVGGAGRSLSATFRVENVLDRHYHEIANLPGRGRVVFVGARMGLGGK